MAASISAGPVDGIWNHMVDLIQDVNGIVGPVLIALVTGLLGLWRHQIKAMDRERTERHKELSESLHLWRNKFSAMETKLELVNREREWLSTAVGELRRQVEEQHDEIKARDQKIENLQKRGEELQDQVNELRRRLSKYEPENQRN